jgi:hypothetical protein
MFCVHLVFCPESALMGFDHGAANIQAHAHTIVFGAEKGLKHALNDGFCDSAAAISHSDAQHGGEGAGIEIG